jgi:hypothetical protein
LNPTLLAEAQAEARQQVSRVLDERLANLATKLQRDMGFSLNQSVRRLRTFESEAQWSGALIDAVASFCTRALLFMLNANTLRLQGVDLTPIPVATVPAFAEAISTKEPIVAMRTRGELSIGLVNFLHEVPSVRCWLFPILQGDRVAAVLYADGEVDTNALELLANIAGAVLPAPSQSTPAGLVALSPAPDRKEHLQAQRKARSLVAEMILFHADALRSGRRNRDLYQALQPEIDTRREVFRRECIENSPGMVDYLHLELLKTLANDDVQSLGVDYPGPLV